MLVEDGGEKRPDVSRADPAVTAVQVISRRATAKASQAFFPEGRNAWIFLKRKVVVKMVSIDLGIENEVLYRGLRQKRRGKWRLAPSMERATPVIRENTLAILCRYSPDTPVELTGRNWGWVMLVVAFAALNSERESISYREKQRQVLLYQKETPLSQLQLQLQE